MKKYRNSLLTALLTGAFCATAALVIGLNTAEDVPAQEIKDTEITTKPIYCYTEMYTPTGDTSFKSYMGYTKITNTNSAQYKLQGECYTDAYGLRRRGSEEAWKHESIALKHWLTLEEASVFFDLDSSVIFALAALHKARV